MQLTHITSKTLRRLIELVESKEKLIAQVEELENEIAKNFGNLATTATNVVKSSGKVIKKATNRAGAKSNSLKDDILSVLKSAGNSGLHVKEIAEKVGRPVANLSVWFSTTGKKHATKVAPGRFAVKSSPDVVPPVVPPAPPVPVKTKKGGLTPEARAKISAAMKARWAARRGANVKTAAPKPAKKSTKASKSSKAVKS